MTKLADYFAGELAQFADPRLLEWEQMKSAGAEMQLEINYWRGPNVFGYPGQDPRMIIHIQNATGSHVESYDWDDLLNAGLIDLNVKAEDERQEGARFSFGLRGAFHRATVEFGHGFFNAVLQNYIQTSEFVQNEVVSVAIGRVTSILIDEEGQAEQIRRCRKLIDIAIRSRALELTKKLNYPPDQARNILIQALAAYLVRRFSRSGANPS